MIMGFILKVLANRIFKREKLCPNMLVRIGSGSTVYEIDRLSIKLEFSGSALSKTTRFCFGKRTGISINQKNFVLRPILAELCQVDKNRRVSVPVDRLVKHVGPIPKDNRTVSYPTPNDLLRFRKNYDDMLRRRYQDSERMENLASKHERQSFIEGSQL